jgi:hypothetical protein
MADQVRIVEYYTVSVHDRPGEGYWVYSRLQEAGVVLLGAAGFPVDRGRAQLSIVPTDPAALVAAARACECELSPPKRAFLVQGETRVGAMADIYGRLEQKGVNIVAAHSVAAGAGRWGMLLWVKPDDVDRAAKALGVET